MFVSFHPCSIYIFDFKDFILIFPQQLSIMVLNIEEVGAQGLRFDFKIKKEQLEIDKAGIDTNIDIDVSGCLTRVGNDVYL